MLKIYNDKAYTIKVGDIINFTNLPYWDYKGEYGTIGKIKMIEDSFILAYFKETDTYVRFTETEYTKMDILKNDINQLQVLKDIITQYINVGSCGLFNTGNCVGDQLVNLYADDRVQLDFCPDWEYFEVFGLSDEQFDELTKFYDKKVKEMRNG